ncbi:MAG: TRAP transporter substrate-binding protein DctP [Campylobacterota bacterium]
MTKMKMFRNLVIGTALAATSLSAATWKYAFGEGMSDPQGIYANAFKDFIEENSRHKIELYKVGSLGEEADMMEQARAGLLHFIGQSTGYMGGTIGEMDIFTLPYVMPTDTKELDYFFKNSKVVNEMLPEIFHKHGLELLGVFPEGEMAVTTMEEFRSPADLQGKKIRVMPGSPILVETYKAFGASPQPMSWGDLVGALKTGMIDGQENPTVWIEAYGLDDLTNVLTYTGHGHFNASMSANKDFFDGLGKRDQKLVQLAAEHAHKVILNEAQKLDAIGLGRIVRTNPDYKINTLSEEERAPFIEAAKEVQESFAAKNISNKRILNQMMKDLEQAKANAK